MKYEVTLHGAPRGHVYVNDDGIITQVVRAPGLSFKQGNPGSGFRSRHYVGEPLDFLREVYTVSEVSDPNSKVLELLRNRYDELKEKLEAIKDLPLCEAFGKHFALYQQLLGQIIEVSLLIDKITSME